MLWTKCLGISVWFVFSSGAEWLSTHVRIKPLLAGSPGTMVLLNHHGRNSSHRWGHAWAKDRTPKSFLGWSEMFWVLHPALLGILPSGMVAFSPCHCRGATQGILWVSEDSPTYPCFGGPTISLCAFVILWSPGNPTECAKICCCKIYPHGMICRASSLQESSREHRTSLEHLCLPQPQDDLNAVKCY